MKTNIMKNSKERHFFNEIKEIGDNITNLTLENSMLIYEDLKNLDVKNTKIFLKNDGSKENFLEIIEPDFSSKSPIDIKISMISYEHNKLNFECEKKQISIFLSEETNFLLKNCKNTEKNHLIKTVLPFPSSNYLQTICYSGKKMEEICEFNLILNFFGFMINVDVFEILKVLTNFCYF